MGEISTPREPEDEGRQVRRPRSQILIIAGVGLLLLAAGAGADRLLVNSMFGVNVDSWAPWCENDQYAPPHVVPSRTQVWVRNDYGDPLAPGSRAATDKLVAAAVDPFPGKDRIVITSEPIRPNASQGTYVLELRLFSKEKVLGQLNEYALGRACGGVLTVQVASDPNLTALRVTHELGHFFGLPHEATTTYMRNQVLRVDSNENHFCVAQLAWLQKWNAPGWPYVSNWQQQPLCG